MTRLAWVFAAALLAYPSALRAQATATTGEIEGTLTDQQGAALPGATVTARNSGTGFERSAVSDSSGLYRLNLLPLGTYDLTAHLQGFTTLKREGLVLRVGETLTIPLSLKVATVEETVTVTIESPVVDITRSNRAASINETAIDSLPINGRRFQDFVLLTPGAVSEPSRGGTSIGGQRGINSSYSIDGASYDNPFFGGIRGGERGGQSLHDQPGGHPGIPGEQLRIRRGVRPVGWRRRECHHEERHQRPPGHRVLVHQERTPDRR